MPDEDSARDRERLGLSPRQQFLDKLWSYYRCEQYSARKVAWDGSQHLGMMERDTVALAGYVPPGFYIANPTTLPIQFRRPTSPYHLCKVIVDRFTGLLFSQKRHPKLNVPGDPETEDFLNAIADAGRLWPVMMLSRAFGGAVGTCVVGFKLLEGRPVFEVFDPRWCQPKFIDRQQLVLHAVEYKYTFTQEVRDHEGNWHEVEYWYRRVIDAQADTVYQPCLVDERVKPDWKIGQQVQHNLGFCPIVWIQNQANPTEIDGDGDCVGIYELIEAIDRLNAQSEKGVIANCDPTVVVSTDAEMGQVLKGSANAIKLPSGGTASYMEMTGGGIQAAKQKVEDYKGMALEVAQCVLEQPDGTKTATEVDRNYASMLAKADTLREQYGEMGVKRLLNMVLVAAKRLTTPRIQNGSIVRQAFSLPPKIEVDPQTGKSRIIERRMGPGPYQVNLTWPQYFEPNVNDATNAVTAAVSAHTSQLIDQETAAKYIAPFFGVEDVSEMLEQVNKTAMQGQASLEQMALQGPTEGGEGGTAADTAKPEDLSPQQAALNGAQVTALLALAQAVEAGQISAESAMGIIQVSFPVNTQQAFKIVGNLGGKKSVVAQAQAKAAAAAKPPAPGGTGAPPTP
jgi:hypothetical protein